MHTSYQIRHEKDQYQTGMVKKTSENEKASFKKWKTIKNRKIETDILWFEIEVMGIFLFCEKSSNLLKA